VLLLFEAILFATRAIFLALPGIFVTAASHHTTLENTHFPIIR
jgi:hypothetical protein